MLPAQTEVELPLLQAIAAAGGKAAPKDLYPVVTAAFPQITEEDLAEELPSGGYRWVNRVQWARQAMVAKGEISASERGIWAITEAGRARLSAMAKEGHTTPGEHMGQEAAPIEEAADDAFLSMYDAYDAGVRTRVLEQVAGLSPHGFERFAGMLLRAYGFQEVTVSAVGPDGGIDGDGMLRVGLATMRAAFQCKRWSGKVPRPEIDAFRGAIQGEFEQGIFFTTSTFTKPAREVSIKKGAVPIVLLDGDSIVRLMLEKGLGITRRPLYVYAVNVEAVVGEADGN